MNSQAVTITVDGSPMPAYLARPDGDDPRPAVIVLQEIFGVNREVKRITDLVAAAGYVGLAVNYYHRTDPDLNEPYTAEGLQNGFAAAGGVTKATLRADIKAAIEWLNAQAYVHRNRIATWGFCFGGTVAFVTATLDGLCGAICFYGGNIAQALPDGEAAPIGEAAAIQTPLLLAFGGKDEYIPAEAIEKIREALTAAGKNFRIQVYPDQGHAFFRDSIDAFDSSADIADAWDLVQAFLTDHFR